MNDYTIGSISSGTMREEDLIPCFLDEINITPDNETSIASIRERIDFAEDEDNSYEYYGTDEANFDLHELFELLEEQAPPYFYFGSHPGDGADYGFWLTEDVSQEVKDSGGLVVSDLSEVTPELIEENTPSDNGIEEVLHINDHGNASLYSYNVKTEEFTEIWSIV